MPVDAAHQFLRKPILRLNNCADSWKFFLLLICVFFFREERIERETLSNEEYNKEKETTRKYFEERQQKERIELVRKTIVSILYSRYTVLSVGPVWGSNPQPPALQSGILPTELTRQRLNILLVFYLLNNLGIMLGLLAT